MARKKKASAPMANSKEQNAFHTPTQKNSEISTGSNHGTARTSSDPDELVIPPRSMLHPSAGLITRGEMEAISQMDQSLFSEVRQQAQGGVNSTPASPPQAEGPPKENSWSQVVSGLSAKGTSLNYIQPHIHDGKLIAQLQEAELKAGTKKWETAIMFYVVGFEPTFLAIKHYIAKNWKCTVIPDILRHDDGYFVDRFDNIVDQNTVLAAGPHFFNNKPIILKPWNPRFDMDAEVIKTIPLWIRLPKLPLNCWTTNSLSRIGSLLGTPLCADECTTKQLRISFARLMVEIDVTKPLQRSVWLTGMNGTIFEQQVLYEWAPPFCNKCQAVGHNCERVRPAPKQPERVRTAPKPQPKKKWQPKPGQPKPTKQAPDPRKGPEPEVTEPNKQSESSRGGPTNC